jgi:hypothetical protein
LPIRSIAFAPLVSPAARHLQRKCRPEGTGQQKYRPFAQAFAHILGDLYTVTGELLHADFPGRTRARKNKGFATAALIPLDEGEMLLPGTDVRSKDGVRTARPAVDQEQDWVVAILAPDPDPLINPADFDEEQSRYNFLLAPTPGGLTGREALSLQLRDWAPRA